MVRDRTRVHGSDGDSESSSDDDINPFRRQRLREEERKRAAEEPPRAGGKRKARAKETSRRWRRNADEFGPGDERGRREDHTA
jgi:hypothetical protein